LATSQNHNLDAGRGPEFLTANFQKYDAIHGLLQVVIEKTAGDPRIGQLQRLHLQVHDRIWQDNVTM